MEYTYVTPQPELPCEFMALDVLYAAIKSVNFLTGSLRGFPLWVHLFDEPPFTPQTPKRSTFFLQIFFSQDNNASPSIDVLPTPGDNRDPEILKAVPQKFLLLKNFDQDSPVYNEEPVYIGNIGEYPIFLRAKVQRPYKDAQFRDVTFTFYTRIGLPHHGK